MGLLSLAVLISKCIQDWKVWQPWLPGIPPTNPMTAGNLTARTSVLELLPGGSVCLVRHRSLFSRLFPTTLLRAGSPTTLAFPLSLHSVWISPCNQPQEGTSRLSITFAGSGGWAATISSAWARMPPPSNAPWVPPTPRGPRALKLESRQRFWVIFQWRRFLTILRSCLYCCLMKRTNLVSYVSHHLIMVPTKDHLRQTGIYLYLLLSNT